MKDNLAGFNGQRPDPLSGHINLGNGYRAYNPVPGRFSTPDNWSPFGAGGINPYAYCAGDPVNLTDPTGHFSLGQWIGMGIGFIAGVALSIVTEGAAMPVVLTLMTTVAGDAATGAGAELATEAIDGRRINWDQVGVAAGLSAVTSLAGFGLGRISKLKGISNRPFGGLMMAPENTVPANLPLPREIYKKIVDNINEERTLRNIIRSRITDENAPSSLLSAYAATRRYEIVPKISVLIGASRKHIADEMRRFNNPLEKIGYLYTIQNNMPIPGFLPRTINENYESLVSALPEDVAKNFRHPDGTIINLGESTFAENNQIHGFNRLQISICNYAHNLGLNDEDWGRYTGY